MIKDISTRLKAKDTKVPKSSGSLPRETSCSVTIPISDELQEEVDALLSTTIDPVMRLEILFMLMTDRLMELRAVFTELMKLARTAVAEE